MSVAVLSLVMIISVIRSRRFGLSPTPLYLKIPDPPTRSDLWSSMRSFRSISRASAIR